MPAADKECACPALSVVDSRVAGAAVEKVENLIRAHVYSSRIRVLELFRDYDPLRGGYITANQFRRGLAAVLEKGPSLRPSEYEELIAHYNDSAHGRINYKNFILSIDKVFGAQNLEKTPSYATPSPKEICKTARPLTPQTQQKCDEILERIRQYVRHHSFDVKSWYQDFDKHNSGFVTVNQYRRGFPQNLASEEEIDTLLNLFVDDATQTVNYFKFNVHVNRKDIKPKATNTVHVLQQKLDNSENDAQHHPPVGTEEILETIENIKSHSHVVKDALERLKSYVYTHRIRLRDFFSDYDKLNKGVVTEHQFRSVLKNVEIPFFPHQLDAIVKAYKKFPDSLTAYRLFCDDVEEIFTSHVVEKDPTKEICPPKLYNNKSNDLSPDDEMIYLRVRNKIRDEVRCKRINMMCFFKDFDKRAGGCGQITKSQFARLLSLIGIQLTQKELLVLCDKFQDPFQVNYLNFVSEVEVNNSACESDGSRRQEKKKIQAKESGLNRGGQQRSLVELQLAFEEHVSKQKIRISEYMCDFDKLNSGSICRENFVRSIESIGADLTVSEIGKLADYYADQVCHEKCRWRDLERDVEKVNGIFFNLERQPALDVAKESLRMREMRLQDTSEARQKNTDGIKRGYILGDEQEKQALLMNVVRKVRYHVRRRSINFREHLRTFDKLATNTITQTQLHQVLSHLKIDLLEDELSVLLWKWGQDEKYSLPSSAATGSPGRGGGGGTQQDKTFSRVSRQLYFAYSELADLLAGPEEQNSKDLACMDSRVSPPKAEATIASGLVAKSHQEEPISSGSQNKIEYDARNDTTKTYEGEMEAAIGSTWSKIESILGGLHFRMKKKVKTERIRIWDALRDFDPLGSGRITAQQMLRALSRYGFEISDDEGTVLTMYYGSPAVRHGEPPMVSYRLLVDDMESVFTQKNMESTPTAEPAVFEVSRHRHGEWHKAAAESVANEADGNNEVAARVARGDGSKRQQRESASDPATRGRCDTLLRRLADELRRRRMYVLMRYLEDHDHMHRGAITRAQFRAALSMAGCLVDDNDADVLFRSYTLEDDAEKIDYYAFNEDLGAILKQG